jgi:hypothetical protein
VTASRSRRLTGYVKQVGDLRNALKVLVGKLARKNYFGRPKGRWKDAIKEVGVRGTLVACIPFYCVLIPFISLR